MTLAEAARPLAGSTVVVTRAADKADRLVAPLRALGAEVLSYAATRIEPRQTDHLLRAAGELARYDWIVFTSASAVALTFDAAAACGVTIADWAHVSVACVGSATADAVRARGVEPSLVPERFVAEGLLQAFESRGGLTGALVLYPAAAGARRELREGMRALGARVEQIEAYETVPGDADVDDVLAALREGRVHAVTLTAKSAVDAWVSAVHPLHTVAVAVSIGPVTTRAAHDAGMRVAAEAMPSTIEGLVAAVVRAIGAQRGGHHQQTNIS
ncbi:MAG TPA: uroporphyrinogen-III synthase [Gemmatimonadaceae bacterium]|nr:uroporphyrinogen-III synthase [Gemmatimonadaceae bacterium]